MKKRQKSTEELITEAFIKGGWKPMPVGNPPSLPPVQHSKGRNDTRPRKRSGSK